MTEQLDPQSKILVATQVINFSCHTIQMNNEFFKFLDASDKGSRPSEKVSDFLRNERKNTDQFLEAIAKKMTDIANEVGDFMNNRDICVDSPHIDLLTPAFDVLNENDKEE
jgi:hypothetical protein